MGDFLIIPCLNCIKINQKQAWWSLIYFAWMKSMYFREYVCRFSRKLHYFCILGVSHLNGAVSIVLPSVAINDQLGLLHTLHAGIRLLLWWNVACLSITETDKCFLHPQGWMSKNICTDDQYPGVCTGDIMLQFNKALCKWQINSV